MIAVDTNVLVRYVTNDEPDQARLAARLLAGGDVVLVAPTVLLETEWVLRAVYELDRSAILTALRQVLGLRSVHVDNGTAIAAAVERYAAGFDFADALHLALSAPAAPMLTFDKRFVRAAADSGARVALLGAASG